MRVCGPRYCGPGCSNRSAGFRRRAPVCPPPCLHKCRATLRRPAERCGKTVVPSWNSREAGRDGHQGRYSEVYLNCDVHANSIPNLMEFRYVIGTDAPNLLSVPDPRDLRSVPNPEPAEHARLPWRCRARWRSGWAGAGTEVHGERPSWVVSPVPLQGVLATCMSGTASTRLKQCR